MSREIYDRPPAEFAAYRQIRCPRLPEVCSRCNKPTAVFDVSWWKVCHHCRILYIVNPRKCWHFREWNQLNCCKSCHGQNKTFQHVSRVYTMNDGRLVDVCCAVANWLKGRGFVNPEDPGIGDDELLIEFHPKPE